MKYCCIECNKKIKNFYAKRCKSCANKKSAKLRMKNRRSYKDKNNPAYKKGLPKCIGCGKILSRYDAERCKSCSLKSQQGKNNPNYGKKHLGLNAGKKHWNYIDGKSKEPYSLKFNEFLKELIRNRDNYICQLCGIEQEDYYRKLDIHHIDYNKQNCDEDNLISLCQKCNIKVNYNRNYWYAYFTYIMENIKQIMLHTQRKQVADEGKKILTKVGG